MRPGVLAPLHCMHIPALMLASLHILARSPGSLRQLLARAPQQSRDLELRVPSTLPSLADWRWLLTGRLRAL